MRVGLVIYGELDTLSGGYLYDQRLVEHLCESGDQVEIFSLPPRSYAGNLSDNLSQEFMTRLRDADLDALIQDELNHPSLALTNRRLRRQIRYPIVSIVHHLRSSEFRAAWQNRLYRFVERKYLQTVDGFVFNSQTTRTSVEALVGGDKPSVVAFPAGDRFEGEIGHTAIVERARTEHPLRIVFVGSVIPRKGLHTLLDALSRLPESDWCLTVIGPTEADAEYTALIRRRIHENGLTRKVSLLGGLRDDALAEQLRASDIMAMPSSYEGFGIAYLEAMGFGLPVVASTSGAAWEIVTDGVDGWLVEPGDAGAIAERLSTLASDRERLVEMSIAARCRFERHPTWDQSMSQIQGFLTTLTGAE